MGEYKAVGRTGGQRSDSLFGVGSGGIMFGGAPHHDCPVVGATDRPSPVRLTAQDAGMLSVCLIGASTSRHQIALDQIPAAPLHRDSFRRRQPAALVGDPLAEGPPSPSRWAEELVDPGWWGIPAISSPSPSVSRGPRDEQRR